MQTRSLQNMFGIIFLNHPDLRRILTWNGFGSYPLRKDYSLPGDRGGLEQSLKIISPPKAASCAKLLGISSDLY